VSQDVSTGGAPLQFPVQTVRGVKDVLPQEIAKWQHLESSSRDLFARYGFREIRTPIFEVTGLFARSIGEATDIVEKEMYTFADRNGQSLSLRPEGTAGVIRAYIQNGLQQESLTRLYYTGPMFRHERPQAGRLRQFHQIGVEALGSASPALDAEVITMLSDLFDTLDIRGLTLEVNSIGCPDCRPGYTRVLKEWLAEKVDALCENCVRRKDTNPLRVLDCKVPTCGEATGDAPVITDHLCDACATHADGVYGRLEAVGLAYKVNPRMVRGLDYYTRTAFEWTTAELGAQNTVAAGGRYDSLNAQLGGKERPGIGFALGVERLLMLLPELAAASPDLYLVALGEEAEISLLGLVRSLRADGVRVDRNFDGGSLKAQLKRANKSGARYCLIVGETELAQGRYILKDMAEGGQEEIEAADAAARIRAALG